MIYLKGLITICKKNYIGPKRNSGYQLAGLHAWSTSLGWMLTCHAHADMRQVRLPPHEQTGCPTHGVHCRQHFSVAAPIPTDVQGPHRYTGSCVTEWHHSVAGSNGVSATHHSLCHAAGCLDNLWGYPRQSSTQCGHTCK